VPLPGRLCCTAILATTLSAARLAAAAAPDPPIEVNPNRPTFATPAQTTQVGVVELELGAQRTRFRDHSGLSWSPFLLKVGLLSNVELRLGGTGVLRQTQAMTAPATGFGDVTVGAQWRFLRHRPLGVDEAVQVTWKVPTASASKGLGTGESDATLMLLLSRDLGPFHADVNLLETWLGRRQASRERQPAATVSVSRTLSAQWSLTGEIYYVGATAESLRIVSNLWALAFKLSPRLVIDGGADVGLSHGAQEVSVFAGLTVGVSRFRPPGETPATATASSARTEAQANTELHHGRRSGGG
jgi:hypothetical protein